jgi:hypothetical protein
MTSTTAHSAGNPSSIFPSVIFFAQHPDQTLDIGARGYTEMSGLGGVLAFARVGFIVLCITRYKLPPQSVRAEPVEAQAGEVQFLKGQWSRPALRQAQGERMGTAQAFSMAIPRRAAFYSKLCDEL